MSTATASPPLPPKPIRLALNSSDTYLFKSGQVIQVSISQLFNTTRIHSDLNNARTKRISETFTRTETIRRVLNRRRPIRISDQASLRPVAWSNDKFDSFWAVGAALHRHPHYPVYFVPFEYKSSGCLFEQLTCDPLCIPPANLHGGRLLNCQSNGSVRLYPRGIGIVTLLLTLTFERAIDLRVVDMVVRRAEDFYFLDVSQKRLPCAQMLTDAVDGILSTLFPKSPPSALEVCWRPPTSIYLIRGGDNPSEEHLNEKLALMLDPPEPDLDYAQVLARVERATSSRLWIEDGIATGVLKNVAFSLTNDSIGTAERSRRMHHWVREAYELTRVGAYAVATAREELANLANLKLLDKDWYPGSSNGQFESLISGLKSYRDTKRAAFMIGMHLADHGTKFLCEFAASAWTGFNRTENTDDVTFEYVRTWIATGVQQGHITEPHQAALVSLMNDIKHIADPFKSMSGSIR